MSNTTFVPNTKLDVFWNSLFADSQYPAIRLAVILFAWHQFIFIGRYIPYWICDHIPMMAKYRLQPDKHVSNEQWWICVKTVIRDQFLLQWPMMMGFHPVASSLGMKFLDAPIPSWVDIATACLFFLVVEDCYHYFVHRLLHYGPFYKYIHKKHHKYAAPFGIAAEYAHPLETVILGMGFFIGPLVWCLFGEMHVFTVAIWLAVRLIQTVDAHSGYEFPWSLRFYIPFWAGTEFHDYHHMAFVGNYATSFRWWDYLFGTSRVFHAYKAKKAKEKAE